MNKTPYVQWHWGVKITSHALGLIFDSPDRTTVPNAQQCFTPSSLAAN